MSEKILFSFDEVAANLHLENVMQRYVNPVASIAATIANFGIGKPTRAMLFDAIYKGGETLHDALLGKASIPDDDTLAKIVTDAIADKMATISTMAATITKSRDIIYNGMAVNNPLLFDMVAVDDDGRVSLDEKHAEMMREASREYISTPKGIKLHRLQKNIVDAMQKIQDELHSVIHDKNMDLHPTARLVYNFPGRLFTMEMDDDGRTIFKPVNINFDAFPLDD